MYLEECSDLTRRFGAVLVMEWINKVYTCFDESAPIPPRDESNPETHSTPRLIPPRDSSNPELLPEFWPPCPGLRCEKVVPGRLDHAPQTQACLACVSLACLDGLRPLKEI